MTNKTTLTFFAVLVLAASAVWFYLDTIDDRSSESSPLPECGGVPYMGAWFEAHIPEGFEARPSLVSAGNDGYDSVWFESTSFDLRLYVYSPQWGGAPSDVLSDAAIKEVTEQKEVGSKKVIVERTIAYNDGGNGYFTSTESQEYFSHLTTGYQTKHKQLTQQQQHIYDCFVQSIQQFTD